MTVLLILLVSAVIGIAAYDVLFLHDDGYGRLGGYPDLPRSHPADHYDQPGWSRLP